jgi:hypothetical protein
MLKYVYLFLISSELYHKRMLNFVKAFLPASIGFLVWLLPLILFVCCISFIDLYTMNHHWLLDWNQLGYYMWSFNVLLNLDCRWFIEYFCTCVHQENWFVIFFLLLCPYPVLALRLYWLCRKNLEAFISLYFIK